MIRARSLPFSLLICTVLCSIASASHALVFRTPGSRAGTFDVSIVARYQDSANYNFNDGAKAHTDSSWGWGFDFGYNFTDHFNFGFDLSADSIDYSATFMPSWLPGTTARVDGQLDTYTAHFNATWNFLRGPVTPFVTAGVGWTYVDSNFSNGPPQIGCWWDPWFGYVCANFQDTKDETDFSWSAAVGLRWDVTDTVFLRGSVGTMWVDLNHASGTSDVNIGKVEIGFMY